MSFKTKVGVLVCALVVMASSAWANKVTRPTSSYGMQSDSQVGSIVNVTNTGISPISGNFQELFVACTATPCGGATSPYNLLINTPVFATGTTITFNLGPLFDSSADSFGLMDACSSVIPFCITSASVTNSSSCESSILNGLNDGGPGSVKFTVPSCAAGGITLFFDESSGPNGPGGYASISASSGGATAAPEPSSALLLGLGLVGAALISRRLSHS